MNYLVGWIAILILCIVIEIATSQLLTVWFITGSLAAILLNLMQTSIAIQITGFILVAVLTLIVCIPFVRKQIQRAKSNAINNNIGKVALVTEDINSVLGTGRVNCSGVMWAAETEDNSEIKSGERVNVTGISGVKLIVKHCD